MRRLHFTILILVGTLAFGQLRTADKARINECKRISELFGDEIWDGYNDTPFSILYVMDDYEYLMGHSDPPEGFEAIGFDEALATDVYWRPTQMNKAFLATFPFAGINTVVIWYTSEYRIEFDRTG